MLLRALGLVLIRGYALVVYLCAYILQARRAYRLPENTRTFLAHNNHQTRQRRLRRFCGSKVMRASREMATVQHPFENLCRLFFLHRASKFSIPLLRVWPQRGHVIPQLAEAPCRKWTLVIPTLTSHPFCSSSCWTPAGVTYLVHGQFVGLVPHRIAFAIFGAPGRACKTMTDRVLSLVLRANDYKDTDTCSLLLPIRRAKVGRRKRRP